MISLIFFVFIIGGIVVLMIFERKFRHPVVNQAVKCVHVSKDCDECMSQNHCHKKEITQLRQNKEA